MTQAVWERTMKGGLLVDQGADDHRPSGGADVENDIRMVGEQEIGPTFWRGNDEHVVRPGLHDVGDVAEGLTCLIDHLKTDHLIEKILPRLDWSGVGSADSNLPRPVRHRRFWGLNAFEADEQVARVDASAEESMRRGIVTEIDLLDRTAGEPFGIVAGGANLQFAAHAVGANDDTDDQIDLVNGSGGVGASRLREAGWRTRHPPRRVWATAART